jgi:hypothetical protein
MPLSRTSKSRNQLAETRRLLASIKVSIPGRGTVTVADMFEQTSASDDPRIRAGLARGLEHLAAALQDSLVEWFGDEVREMVHAKWSAQQPGSEVP